MIPEIIGRLPILTYLNPLDRDTLRNILTEPKNSILKQYKKLFALDKVELDFEKSALEAVAQKAIDRRTGARGLRAILEKAMMDMMYNIPSEENVESCIVTEDVIDGIGEPVIGYKEKAVAGTRKKKGFKEIEEMHE